MSPRVNQRQIAQVLLGTGPYDELSEQEQAISNADVAEVGAWTTAPRWRPLTSALSAWLPEAGVSWVLTRPRPEVIDSEGRLTAVPALDRSAVSCHQIQPEKSLDHRPRRRRGARPVQGWAPYVRALAPVASQ